VRGCAVSGLISLLGLVAITAALAVGLRAWSGIEPQDAIGALIFAGVFGWMSASLLISAVTALRERAALRASTGGGTPSDGRRTILAGYIEPAGAPLRAPLTDRECVACSFEIYEMKRVGKSTSKVVYADGIALTPSLIVTRGGSYRLLAVPELDCEDADLDRTTAEPRARELMRTLPYTPQPAPFTTRPSIEAQWNDDDGAYSRMTRHVEGSIDLTQCRLTERYLERGARVCVFGYYSAAKRAIVADPSDWSKITRVMKGDPDAIAAQLSASVMRRLIGAALSAAASAGVIAAFVSSTT
jgi:hypothetical protein